MNSFFDFFVIHAFAVSLSFLLANDCYIEAMQDVKILLDRTCQDHQISS